MEAVPVKIVPRGYGETERQDVALGQAGASLPAPRSV